jgi:hypothetical protein
MNTTYYGKFKKPKQFSCGCTETYGSPVPEYGLPEIFILPCCSHTTMKCLEQDCLICRNKNDKVD